MTSARDTKRDYSEPAYAKFQDRRACPFYRVNIDHRLAAETRELLEVYSKVSPERQSEHIHQIRDQAFDIRAYPCIGLGSWLTPQLRRLPIYPEILQRVKDGAFTMDVGTFIGHDLRRLVFDGAPSERLYGVDIVSHFKVGYDFFRDRETFKGHFIEADFLSDDSSELTALKAKVDVIIISQVLHQWDWDHQVSASVRLVAFSKSGTLVVGNQIGNVSAQEIALKDSLEVGQWRHNPESFARMWTVVGEATQTRWETQAWLRTFPEMGWDASDASWMEDGVRVIEFVARRVA
ncbi:hypothetical protein LTR62_000976 [Meristemomyces frigidus]|uniref:Methyltransferase domain-containing protein n=1 Tax=Meristemomyces frigidus TaxID=1508187 RepID=A0AAN7TH71_9PEZI|nr:hypothetical protein LTR62_000976 [Meristemomyces frigidus]